MTPGFSVILPTYNRAYVLWRAVESVLAYESGAQTKHYSDHSDGVAVRAGRVLGQAALTIRTQLASQSVLHARAAPARADRRALACLRPFPPRRDCVGSAR